MSDKHTILLVDDNENDTFLVRSAFKKAGANNPLQEVHNGVEAIAYLRGDAPYDERDKYPLPVIMLLDLNMPMKTGFDVLTWLRAQPGLKRLSVIILTASMRMEDVERAFDLGANSFFVKPSSLEDLTAIARFLCDWLHYSHFPPLNESVRP